VPIESQAYHPAARVVTLESELIHHTEYVHSFCLRLSSFLSLLTAFVAIDGDEYRPEWRDWQKCFRNARLGKPEWDAAGQFEGSQNPNEECVDQRLASHLSSLMNQMLKRKGVGFFGRMKALSTFRCVAFLLSTGTTNIGSYCCESIKKCFALDPDMGPEKRFESLSSLTGMLIRAVGQHFKAMERARIDTDGDAPWTVSAANQQLAKITSDNWMSWEHACENCYAQAHHLLQKIQIFDFVSPIRQALIPPNHSSGSRLSMLTLCAKWLQYCFTAPLLAVAYLLTKLIQDWVINPIARIVTVYMFRRLQLIDRLLNAAFDAVRKSPIPEPTLGFRFPIGWDRFLIFIWEHIEDYCRQQINAIHDPSQLQMLERRATVKNPLPFEEMQKELIDTTSIALELMSRELPTVAHLFVNFSSKLKGYIQDRAGEWSSTLLSSQLADFLAYMAQRPLQIAEITSGCCKALANVFSVSAELPQIEAQDLHAQQSEKRRSMLVEMSKVINYISSSEGAAETDKRLAHEISALLSRYDSSGPVDKSINLTTVSIKRVSALQAHMSDWKRKATTLCLKPEANTAYKPLWDKLQRFQSELICTLQLLETIERLINRPTAKISNNFQEAIHESVTRQLEYLSYVLQIKDSHSISSHSIWWCSPSQRKEWHEKIQDVRKAMAIRTGLWQEATAKLLKLESAHKQLAQRKAKITQYAPTYRSLRDSGIARQLLLTNEREILAQLAAEGIKAEIASKPETEQLVHEINSDPLMNLDKLQELITQYETQLIVAAREAERESRLKLFLVTLTSSQLEYQIAHQLIGQAYESFRKNADYTLSSFKVAPLWEELQGELAALSDQIQQIHALDTEKISDEQLAALLDRLTHINASLKADASIRQPSLWQAVFPQCSFLGGYSHLGAAIAELNPPINSLLTSLKEISQKAADYLEVGDKARASSSTEPIPDGYTGPFSTFLKWIGSCALTGARAVSTFAQDGSINTAFWLLNIPKTLDSILDKYILSPAAFTNLMRTGVYLVAADEEKHREKK